MTQVALLETSEAYTHVAVRGRLDAAGVEAVDFTLTSQIEARGKPTVIDLSGVDFIASLGIALLVRIARDMRENGLKVAVVAANQPVRGVLEMMKMEPLFPVVGTRDEALRALGVP